LRAEANAQSVIPALDRSRLRWAISDRHLAHPKTRAMRHSCFHPLLLAFSSMLLCLTVQTHAQKANRWYFGSAAGIDFSAGAPAPLVNGQMMAYEGTGSICNEDGDLLFYTNGGRVLTSNQFRYGRVYNRNHQVMANGDLEFSGGCNSAKQGALIVQDPGNTAHYYLFTLDCAEHGNVGGLRYCEVDMTANLGLGAVTSIGNPLLSGVTESMVGIRHANGIDVWVLVHGLNNSDYHAFLVTSTGITGPVTTTIGAPVDNQPGDLAVNLTSTKVHYSTTDDSNLLDFDPTTGMLSNLVDLDRNVMGCAFARGGQYLYTCESQSTRRVYQYDLLAPDIQASEQIIGSGVGFQTALQLAPDGKIYMARVDQEYLGVIHNPDLAGAASDFQEAGFYLGGRECQAGLPGFVNDLLTPSTVGIADGASAPALQCMVIDDQLVVHAPGISGRGRLQIFRSDGALIHEESIVENRATVPISRFSSALHVVRVINGHDRISTASLAIVF